MNDINRKGLLFKEKEKMKSVTTVAGSATTLGMRWKAKRPSMRLSAGVVLLNGLPYGRPSPDSDGPRI